MHGLGKIAAAGVVFDAPLASAIAPTVVGSKPFVIAGMTCMVAPAMFKETTQTTHVEIVICSDGLSTGK